MSPTARRLKREKRSQAILEKLLSGMTLQDVANEEGISRQAIHYVLLPSDRAIHKEHREQQRETAKERRERAQAKRRARQWANKPQDRFWENVDIRGEDECWEWQLNRICYGYGQLYRWGQQRSRYAHRIAWELTNGPIPDGMCVCHHCDNPPCCNPAHLFLGTPRDNTHDSIAKGRWGSKFTWEQVEDIRREYAAGETTQAEIARQRGVSPSTIHCIVNYKTWKGKEEKTDV